MLTNAGDQVPVMPFSEAAGNTGAVAPAQNAAIGSKVGVIWSVMVISIVVDTPQLAASGVKV